MKNYKFILSGGGTGGHIYPAIAIANELKERFPDSEILFVGAKDKMEMQKVPSAGYKIKGIWISGLQRKFSIQNAMLPAKIISSLLESRKIIANFNPDIVIGTGGFASGPLLKIASMTKIPTLIQEQNSYPGITNKLLAKKASVICVAYENMARFFSNKKIIITGNPVRNDLIDCEDYKTEAIKYYNLDTSKKTVLILGGSLGSRKINELIEKELPNILNKNIQVIWQCGKLYYEEYRKYETNNVKIIAFVEKMNFVYAAADIIISRAGASTISELCIVGKPVIFIPSPNLAEDHQTKNALAISEKNAAIVIKENELETFSDLFENLLKDEVVQRKIAENIKKMAKPRATKDIVDEIEKVLKN